MLIYNSTILFLHMIACLVICKIELFKVEVVGEHTLQFKKIYIFCFRKCLFYFQIYYNLVLISRFYERFYKAYFNEHSVSILKNGVNICTKNLEHLLCMLNQQSNLLLNCPRLNNPYKKVLNISPNNDIYGIKGQVI